MRGIERTTCIEFNDAKNNVKSEIEEGMKEKDTKQLNYPSRRKFSLTQPKCTTS